MSRTTWNRWDIIFAEIDAADRLLDFSKVEHMASYMIAKLYLIEKKHREQGGRFKICGMQPLPRDF